MAYRLLMLFVLPLLSSGFEMSARPYGVQRPVAASSFSPFMCTPAEGKPADKLATPPATPKPMFDSPLNPVGEDGGGGQEMLVKNVGIFAVLAVSLIFSRGGTDNFF